MYTKNINDLINELETNDRNLKTRILKDIAKLIDWSTIHDLKRLTIYLLKTNDVEINFKIFVLLGLAITSNPHHRIILAKSRGLYTKANYLLSKGLLSGSVGLLNYFTALVIVEGEEANTASEANNAATFAKHAIRTSGCLREMNNYFLNKFMCTDIWRPLCRCLAECCRSVPLSQQETSHLLPRCIQELKRDRNVELILLVQAILENHTLNKTKFLQFQGIQCFTLELLQMSQGLHLLYTVIDDYKEAIEAAIACEIHKILRELAKVFDVGSELEKWCSLALFQLSSSNALVVPVNRNNTNINTQFNTVNTTSTKTVPSNVKETNKNNKTIEIQDNGQNLYMDVESIDQSFEFLQQQFYQQINKFDAITKPFVRENNSTTDKQNTRNVKKNMTTSNLLQRAPLLNETNAWIKSGLENYSSMSFSQMQNRQMSMSKTNKAIVTNRNVNKQLNNITSVHKNNYNVMSQSEQSCQTSFVDERNNPHMMSFGSSSNRRFNQISFYPHFTSTPRHNLKRFDQKFNFEEIPYEDVSTFCESIDLSKNRFNNRNKRKSKQSKNLSVNELATRKHCSKHVKSRSRFNKTLGDGTATIKTQKTQNQSLITSVLNVTTFGLFGRVKTFLSGNAAGEEQKNNNLASHAETESKSSDSNLSETDVTRSTIFDLDADNNSSFLGESIVIRKGKFNRKLFKKKDNSNNYTMTNDIACVTCDDTLKLRRKVNQNKHLKEIIRILQVGVRKYGSNFEKICQVYWPDDESITPKDLSHLYNKIVAKK